MKQITNCDFDKVNVDYFLDGKEFWARNTAFVPIKGDNIRYKKNIYKVIDRIWIYDEPFTRVVIDIEFVGEEK